jgi:hypothetical protein
MLWEIAGFLLAKWIKENSMSEQDSIELSDNKQVLPSEDHPPRGNSLKDSVVRISRLGLGLVLVGGEEISRAMKQAETRVAEVSAYPEDGAGTGSDAEIDQLRYLALGTAINLQKRATNGIKQGVRFSLRASGAAFGTFYALTDNRLLRPVQKPVDQFLTGLARETDDALRVGKLEEQRSKTMAKQTVGGLVDTGIDAISDNPKITNLITEQLGAQSVGMIGILLDSVRSWTAKADDYAEKIIRKVFFLSTLHELPKSPIEGKPQLMYLPEDLIPPGIM